MMFEWEEIEFSKMIKKLQESIDDGAVYSSYVSMVSDKKLFSCQPAFRASKDRRNAMSKTKSTFAAMKYGKCSKRAR